MSLGMWIVLWVWIALIVALYAFVGIRIVKESLHNANAKRILPSGVNHDSAKCNRR